MEKAQEKSWGFTLAELVVALTLGTILGSLTLTVFVSLNEAYSEQLERTFVGASLRTATWVVSSELRPLGNDVSIGPDLLDASATSVTYRATRSWLVTCDSTAEVGSSSISVGSETWGQRSPDPAVDSISLWTGTTWINADLLGITTAECADGKDGLGLQMSRPLASVDVGAPVRVFEVARLSAYRSKGYWLGFQRWRKATGWTRRQPVAGPYAPGGLRFEFWANGSRVSEERDVSLVVFTATAGDGDSLTTSIALRNR